MSLTRSLRKIWCVEGLTLSWGKWFVLLVALTCSVLPFSVSAQPRVFRNWEVKDGLSQSSVTEIFQDSEGKIWVGTADGLNLFDGHSFRAYKQPASNLSDLRSNYVADRIIEESPGRLLVVMKDGIYRFNTYTGTFSEIFLESDSAFGRPNDIGFMGVDSEGNFWYYQSLGYIYKINPGSTRAQTIYKAPKRTFPDAKLLNDKEVLISFLEGWQILSLHTKQTRTVSSGAMGSANVHAMEVVHDTLFIASENGLFRFDSRTSSIEPVIRDVEGSVLKAVCFFYSEESMEWWIGTVDRGLFVLDQSRQEMRGHYAHSKGEEGGISAGAIRALCVDQMEKVWVGLDAGGLGLTTLNPSSWTCYSDGIPQGLKLESDYIRSLLWVDDHLLIGPIEGGIVRYNIDEDRSEPAVIRGASADPLLNVGHLMLDGHGRVWASSRSGIFVSLDGAKSFDRVSTCSGGEITLVQKSISLRNNKVLVYSENGMFVATPDKECLEEVQIKHAHLWMFEDEEESIWTSSYFGPLAKARYLSDSQGDRLEVVSTYFDQLNVRSFVEDTIQGVLWMATEKGIMSFHKATEKAKLYTRRDGLVDDFIYSVFLDESNRVWFTSNGGMGYLDPNTEVVRNFGVQDGLQTTEFNTHAFARGPDGVIFLGGVSGFNSFQPATIIKEEACGQPFLTELKWNGIPVSLDLFAGSAIRSMSSNEARLEFSFSNSDYWNANATHTAFWLEGRDSTWVESSGDGILSIGGLASGTYTLQLKVRNADGVWSAPATVARFEVEGPLWQRPWFIGFAILALAGLIAGFALFISRRRHRDELREAARQGEIQNMRLQISRDIHDDIGSGLTRIVLMNEMTRAGGTEIYSQKITDTARDLTRQLGHIVWSLNPDNDTLQNVWFYIRQEFGRYFEGTEINAKFNAASLPENLILDPRQRANVIRILREIMHNALKYSGASEVEVNCDYVNGRVLFKAGDNGSGFVEGELRGQGNGLRNIRKRVEEIGGDLSIEGNPGSGVVVSFSFPSRSTT